MSACADADMPVMARGSVHAQDATAIPRERDVARFESADLVRVEQIGTEWRVEDMPELATLQGRQSWVRWVR